MAAQDNLVLLLPPHLHLLLRIHMMKRRGAPISGSPSLIHRSAYILILPLLFAPLIDVCSLEPGVFLCVSCDWTGFMGSSRWKFRVRIFITTSFDTLPHGVKKINPAYRPARMASGGKLVTSRVAAFHTITTRKVGKLSGRSQMDL